MTVMFNRFFGLPQAIVREKFWSEMKPGEKDLILYLYFVSERYSTKQITVTDAEICEWTGTSSRTLCNARKKARERGLIQYEARGGNKYTYTLCDPSTRQPYPGEPKQKVYDSPSKSSGKTEFPSPSPLTRGSWEQTRIPPVFGD